MDPRLIARVQLAQAGDGQTLTQPFEQLHPAVLNYAYQVLGDGQSSVCLAQDAFVISQQRRTLRRVRECDALPDSRLGCGSGGTDPWALGGWRARGEDSS